MSDDLNPEVAASDYDNQENATESTSDKLNKTDFLQGENTEHESRQLEETPASQQETNTKEVAENEDENIDASSNVHSSNSAESETSEERKLSVDLADLAGIMHESPEIFADDILLDDSVSLSESMETKYEQKIEDGRRKYSRRSSFSYIGKPRFPRESLSISMQSREDEVKSMESISSSKTESPLSFLELSLQEEEIKVDRHIYYELHALYSQKHNTEKRRNNYLQTKLAEYFKRKRMYHVLLTDPKDEPEFEKKYEKLLDELENLTDQAARDQADSEAEIESLKNKCISRTEELKLLFEKLQKNEYDWCKEVISDEAEGGKANVEKFIERYLKRQKLAFDNRSKMHLVYIKLRNRFNEKQDTLNSLDNLGSNLHLIDYEQSKFDNRNLCDKLEEREMMLSNIRKQCQNAMQILAHTREKSSAIDIDIEGYKERLEGIMEDFMDAREQLSTLKHARDDLRVITNKLTEEAGLLTKPKLLRDMERSIKEFQEGQETLLRYKLAYDDATQELRYRMRSVAAIDAGAKCAIPKKYRESLS